MIYLRTAVKDEYQIMYINRVPKLKNLSFEPKNTNKMSLNRAINVMKFVFLAQIVQVNGTLNFV